MTAHIRTTLVVALLVLAVVEATLHLRGDRLPTEFLWTAADRIPQMRQLRDAGISSEVVLVGNSSVLVGVQVPILETALPAVARISNVGVGGAAIDMNRRWVLDEVLPMLHPRRIVWGVTSFEFNEEYSDQIIIDQFEQTTVGKPGLYGWLDRGLASLSMTSRLRERLRGPLWLRHLFDPAKPPLPLEELMVSAPAGAADSLSDQRLEELIGIVRNEMLVGFELSDHKTDLFVSTIEEILEMGIEVVVAVMPVPSAYIEAHPNGPDDYQLFADWIHTAGEALQVPVLDYGMSFADDRFSDYTHLNADGVVEFSNKLGADLGSLGW